MNPKLIFINRYFHPDHSATSQLLTELAVELVASGWSVRVVTGRQLYDDPHARLARGESWNGVRVERVWSTRFGRAQMWGRAFDYLSFFFGAGLEILRIARRGDVIVALTDPPLISAAAVLAAKWRGAYLIHWIQDVFPEIAQQLRIPSAALMGKWLVRLRNAALDHAYCNIVLGERMRAYLASQGIARAKIALIPNWANATAIQPKPAPHNVLRSEWRLGQALVVGYSGNMGRAHEFTTLMGAINALQNEPSIQFLLIGDGFHKVRLQEEARRKNLRNIRFIDYQPRVRLAESLSAIDVHIVSLLPALEGLIVPTNSAVRLRPGGRSSSSAKTAKSRARYAGRVRSNGSGRRCHGLDPSHPRVT
ncbi:MAG: glycosyltransferase family 4 protein [Gammaproteobacteria bacterium]